MYFNATNNLQKFVATVETTKHRIFIFVDREELLEHGVIGFGSADGYFLGILSSSIHVCWTLANGGTLEDRPRYNKDVCFDPFPFPAPGELLKAKIRSVAEELDAFRKQHQKEHPDLTLTQMYNVLEKLKAIEVGQRAASSPPGLSPGSTTIGDRGNKEDVDGRDIGEPRDGVLRTAMPGHDETMSLTPAEAEVKDKGLILILKELHEKLDALVFEAYGWPQTLSDEEILEKLVALNHERAAEERGGHVRWLRPDYQIPRFGKKLDKQAAKEEGAQVAADLGLPEPSARKPSFPSDAVAQTAAVFSALAAMRGPITAETIAAGFRKSKNLDKNVSEVLASLTRLGHITTRDGVTFELRRVA
jgi:hypothetical protein